jgi:hypothetical protein
VRKAHASAPVRRAPANANGPALEDIGAAVYVFPADAAEADGTLAWNETTMVLATVRAGGELGIGWTCAAAGLAAAHSMQVSGHCAPSLHAQVGMAVPNLRHVEYFPDHQRIERLLFDGTLDLQGGALTPDPGQQGLGLQLRTADAEHYRRN